MPNKHHREGPKVTVWDMPGFINVMLPKLARPTESKSPPVPKNLVACLFANNSLL
jgi:hypothetical protein